MKDVNEIIDAVNGMENDNMICGTHKYKKARIDRCIYKDPRGNIRIYDWVTTYDDDGLRRTCVKTEPRAFGWKLADTYALEDELAGFDWE